MPPSKSKQVWTFKLRNNIGTPFAVKSESVDALFQQIHF